LAEVERIATQTQFNGQKILDGTFGNAAFQVGANVGETISLDLTTSMRQGSIGAITTATSVDLDTVITAGTAGTTGSAATYAFDTAALVGDYSTVAAVAGTDTINFGTGTINAGDTVVVNGVTFTFADANAASTVDSATAVTVNVNFTGGATQQDASDAFITAFTAAVTDAGSAGTGAALSGLSAANGSTLTATITDTAAGLAATVGRTVTASDATVTQDVTGSDADTSANRTFTITDPESNVITVTLDSNITNATDFLAEITSATGYGAATFTAAIDGTTATQINITDATNATGSFAIGGTNAALVTAQNVAGGTAAGVADVAAVPATSVVVNNDFSI
jgi:flagellin